MRSDGRERRSSAPAPDGGCSVLTIEGLELPTWLPLGFLGAKRLNEFLVLPARFAAEKRDVRMA